VDASRRLWHPQLLFHPKGISLGVAVIAILVKEALFHYTMFMAEKVRSQMLRAHAWHHRTDAISTVIVFVGIVGTIAGVPWLDAVSAILVGLMIAQIGWSLGWGGVSELLDRGLDDKQLETIKNTIKSVDGVRTLHMLRTRRMSESAFVDVHITVNPRLSVSEGHHIAETVAATLIDQIEEVADVTVHIDAEEDDKYVPGLPLRSTIVERLQKRWQSIETARAIENITLHYLGGKIMVEIYLPLRIVKDARHAEELAQRFIELAIGEPYIHSVQVYYR
jgi:divalent metal cation (Fe/Co/Zn/Cd) transporter